MPSGLSIRFAPRRTLAEASFVLISGAVTACNADAVAPRVDRPDGAARAARIRACSEDFQVGLGLGDAGRAVSFRRDVMPLLVTHCNLAGCHLGDTPTGQLGLGESCTFNPRSMTCDVDGGALTDEIAQKVYANLTAQSHAAPNLKRVEPGSIDRSFLLMKLSGCQDAFEDVTGCKSCGGEMPPNGMLRRYDRPSFDLLARWVREGAPFD